MPTTNSGALAASQVFWPTIPSASRRAQVWNALTDAVVFGPNSPSTPCGVTFHSPGAPLVSISCRPRTAGPVEPSESTGIGSPVGSAARGEVTASKKSGMLLQRGKLAVKLNAITLDGRTILLGSDFKQSAKGGQADDVLKLVLVPEWLLFARGNSARLKAGELLTAEVAESVCFAPGERGYIPASCPAKAETAQAVK